MCRFYFFLGGRFVFFFSFIFFLFILWHERFGLGGAEFESAWKCVLFRWEGGGGRRRFKIIKEKGILDRLLYLFSLRVKLSVSGNKKMNTTKLCFFFFFFFLTIPAELGCWWEIAQFFGAKMNKEIRTYKRSKNYDLQSSWMDHGSPSQNDKLLGSC